MQHFSEGSQWRPLFEDDIAMLQVASGCSHNRCRFCDMYHQPFRVSSMEEVAADVDEMATYYSKPHRLFLTGGNAFCLPARQLEEIAALVKKKLPHIESIGCFARITDVARKSDEDLAALCKAGINLISIGAESGLDEALQRMDKGFTSADIIEQCQRLNEAGMEFALFYLAGIAGKGMGARNAQASAEVFSKAQPKIIMVHTMSCFPGTVLEADIESGSFEPASEKEIQQELREFYARYQSKTFILAAHYGNTVNFNGRLPEDRDEILGLMDRRIALDDEKRLTAFRKSLKSI